MTALLTSRPTATLGENTKPSLTPAYPSERPNVGLTATYHGPSCLSTIGRGSSVHVSLENSRRWYPTSADMLSPTGRCHDSGARTRGRMWSPTYCTPWPERSLVKT